MYLKIIFRIDLYSSKFYNQNMEHTIEQYGTTRTGGHYEIIHKVR